MQYTTNLIYDHPKVSETANDPLKLEPKLQKLDKTSEKILKEFREREKKGILPPVLLKQDKELGFYVEAA